MDTPATFRKLVRPDDDKKLAGVCGGLGAFLGIDPTVVRLVWVLLTLTFGVGVLAYLAAWLIIPRAASARVDGAVLPRSRLHKSLKNKMILGVAGGMADALGTDATLIRLAFAGLCLLGGSGIVAYLVLALILPVEAQPNPAPPSALAKTT